MKINIPKYKMVCLAPLQKTLVLKFWNRFSIESVESEDLLRLNDGSVIILHNSKNIDFVFVEFQCQINVENQSIDFGMLGKFLKFCEQNNSRIRILRNQSEISPYFGAVFSDLKYSLAFKKACHLASHPRDIRN